MPTLSIAIPEDFDVQRLQVQANGFTLAPVFYGNGKESEPCALVEVLAEDGEILSRYLLRVRGRDLTAVLQDRSKPVQARYERGREAEE
ncbi:MAG: hypothetical protein L6R28_13435 [Planctomycetes bacterium]|nr:hypothetical protein [Planctomycetota bacterium]